MLRATSKVREIAERMEKYRWDIPRQIEYMKQDPSTYADCHTLRQYRGLIFELAAQDVLRGLSFDPEAQMEPITGDHPDYWETFGRGTSKKFGPVCLSGKAMLTRKREYDSVVNIAGTPTVFEATLSTRRVQELANPTKIITRLQPLEHRLNQEVAYVIVTIADSFAGTNPESRDIRRSVYDFMNKGGVIVRAPFSCRDFKEEVTGRVIESAFPVHFESSAPTPVYSWMFVRIGKSGRKSNGTYTPHKSRETDAHVRRFLKSEGKRLGLV